MVKNKTTAILICFLILFGVNFRLIAQNSQRPLPPQLPDYQFNSYDSAKNGYYFNTPFKIGAAANGSLNYLTMIDTGAYVFWYAGVPARSFNDFKYHPEHRLYTFNKMVSATEARYMVLNESFQYIDSFSNVNGVTADLHDFLLSSAGTFLIGGASDSIFDLSAYVFNGVPGSATTRCRGFVVQEFDQAHKLIFEWDSNDHIFPTEALPFYGYNANDFDYCHANTIAEDYDGNLLISFRHLNSVYKIHRKTGKVIWRLGGKSSSFSFTGTDRFSGQHDVRRLPNGNIALFDNANTALPPKQSRAVEYRLDTINMVATKVWEHKYQPPFFAQAMGSLQTTADRDHIIGYGLVYRPNPSFIRINDKGELLQELFFKDSVMSYRSYWFDPPTDHIIRPGIKCTPSNTGVVLTATSGYSDYQWSTGEKTMSINIKQPGEYQVWTNYGIGMLGSQPITLTDPAKGCGLSSTQGTEETPDEQQYIYVDMLGRMVTQPEKGNIYLRRSPKGVAKFVWQE